MRAPRLSTTSLEDDEAVLHYNAYNSNPYLPEARRVKDPDRKENTGHVGPIHSYEKKKKYQEGIQNKADLVFINIVGLYNAFEWIGKLASGSFGEASLVRNKFDSSYYVIKRNQADLDRMQKHDRKMLMNEVWALASLSHHNIVHFYFAWQENGQAYMQIEFCNSGALSGWTMKNIKSNRLFKEAELRTQLLHLTSGLSYMHYRGLVHMDLKPDNIFVHVPGGFFDAQKYEEVMQDTNQNIPYSTEDCIAMKLPILKIGDLGLATNNRLLNSGNVDSGDGSFVAPEVLWDRGFKINTLLSQCDIFSLGLTMYYTAVNSASYVCTWGPYYHGYGPYNYVPIKQASEPFNLLIKNMMEKLPNDRPTTVDILKNPVLCTKLRKEEADTLNQSNANAHHEHTMGI